MSSLAVWALLVATLSVHLASAFSRGNEILELSELPAGRLVGYGELHEEHKAETAMLTWHPRMFYYRKLLDEEDADGLVRLAQQQMEAGNLGTHKDSKSTRLERYSDALLTKIEKRLAQISMISSDAQEDMLVFQYKQTQDPTDISVSYENSTTSEGVRVQTMLLYLSTPEAGGESIFPLSDRRMVGAAWSECAKQGGIAIKPAKGDVLLFYHINPDGSAEPEAAAWGSCPLIAGDKWVARVHTRAEVFGLPPAPPEKLLACHNDHEQCLEWAYWGECTKNPGFMENTCKRSCGLCTKPGDDAVVGFVAAPKA